LKEMTMKADIIKKALKHIMGRPYEFKQTDEGYMVVNTTNPVDILLEGKRHKTSKHKSDKRQQLNEQK